MSSLITIKKESKRLIQEVILRPYIDCCRKRHFLQRRSKWNLVSLYDYTFLDNSTNRSFHNKLEKAGMTQSMSRVGKCIDNGPMEGFWGILKRERYYGKRFTDKETLVKMIEDYIDYYNNKRLLRNLGVLTPMEKHEIYLQAA